jgi:hypothetical protein
MTRNDAVLVPNPDAISGYTNPRPVSPMPGNAANSPKAKAAPKAKFADNVLGSWCLDEELTGDYYYFYERKDCGQKKTWLLVGPDRVRREGQDCRVTQITAGPTRRGDALYTLSLRCEYASSPGYGFRWGW